MSKLRRNLYNKLILIFARPSLQTYFETIFRVLYGFLGYGNWSADFRLTGEKVALERLKSYDIKLVLDVGANEGQWSILARQILDSEVIAFEPQKYAFDKLSKINDKKIRSHCVALGDSNSISFINIHSDSSQLSFIDNELHQMPLLNGKSKTKESITIVSLDHLFENEPDLYSKVDFVKIDTEGYERKVLIGAAKFIKKVKPRFVQLEINSHQIFTETNLFSIANLLVGYKIYKILPAGNIFYNVDPTTPLANFMQLSTFLFVRDDIVI
jgi:FkbM family methyltransferase